MGLCMSKCGSKLQWGTSENVLDIGVSAGARKGGSDDVVMVLLGSPVKGGEPLAPRLVGVSADAQSCGDFSTRKA